MTVTTAPTPSRLDVVPSSRNETAWPAVSRVWLWKKTSGRVLRHRYQVDAAVVVEIARGQGAADPRDGPGRPGLPGDVDQAPVISADQEQARHVEGEIGPIVDHVAVRLGEVEPAVVVGVEQDDAKAEQVPARERPGRSPRSGRRKAPCPCS